MTKIVLGGGLSGLSAAYYLAKSSSIQQKIILLESSSFLRGWIRSEILENGVIFEQAPRTIRPHGAAGINTMNLLDQLGLNQDVKPITRTNPAATNRLIYANGELCPLPNSLLSMFVTQKPFSKPLISQILSDFTATPKKVDDESVYEFTKRRFGSEVADYLIDTIICGICAGNSKEVSVNFLMKKMFAYEQQYGSILKGYLRNMFAKSQVLPKRGLLAARAKMERWNVYTFKDGMETFPRAIEKHLATFSNVELKKDSKCVEIDFHNDVIKVLLSNGNWYECDQLISAIPAKNLADLVRKAHPQLAAKLTNIKTVSVAVVNLFYDGNFIRNPAFGFLVPPKEKLPILGVIYDSCAQSLQDKTVLTVMMGGYWFKELFGDNPNEDFILKVATDNLKTILNINTVPSKYKVNILHDCIPQYVVGHERNLDDINDYIKQNNLKLKLCGASYYGVGVNDVILSAKRAIEL